MDAQVLERAGLTGGEARVNLALLDLGPSTSGPIVEKSRVSRSIIYKILASLAQKGLVSHITKEKTNHYSAAGPERLLDYMSRQEKELAENKKKMTQMLPLLMRLSSPKQNEVQVFEGDKGRITVHEHTYLKLKRGEEYFFLNIPSAQPEPYHRYYEKDHARRSRAGIRCRLLFDPKTDPKVLINRNSYTGCEARYMPLEVNAPVWFGGYKDTASITIIAPDSITIEMVNQDIADAFRAYFEEMWKMSKPFGVKRKKKGR